MTASPRTAPQSGAAGLAQPVDKRGVRPYERRFPLRQAASDAGGVAEWLKAADCKSVDVRLRRFESYPLHQRFVPVPVLQAVRAGEHRAAVGSSLQARRNAGVAQW